MRLRIGVRGAAENCAGLLYAGTKPEEWVGGKIDWLLDVMAPDAAMAGAVIRNLKQVVRGSELRMHPVVEQTVTKEALSRMGAKPGGSKCINEDTKSGIGSM